MKHTTSQILYSYWNTVRAGRLAPRRLEIEPSRISGILPETFMLDRASYVYRLAGTRLCELFGSELRGSSFLDGWSGQDRTTVEHQLKATCEQGAVSLLTLEVKSGIRTRFEIEAILLPVLHASDAVSRLLGAMSTSAASPHWLGSEQLTGKRLISHEVIWPNGRPHAVINRMQGMTPFAASTAEQPATVHRQQRFRVFDGGLASAKYHKE